MQTAEHDPTATLTPLLESVATELMTTGDSWAGLIGAWLAKVQQRSGSKRTPIEYNRYVAHFADRFHELGRPLAEATPADAHAFAYATLPDRRRNGVPGKPPGPSSVNVRLAPAHTREISGVHGVWVTAWGHELQCGP